MAILAQADTDQDFGYDFSSGDEEALLELCATQSAVAVNPNANVVHHHDSSNNNKNVDEKLYVAGPMPGEFPSSNPGSSSQQVLLDGIGASEFEEFEDVSYPDLTKALDDVHNAQDTSTVCNTLIDSQRSQESNEHEQPTAKVKDKARDPYDEPSPLKRFRSYPKRPLTVSDLTAGAWCEMQYWYTLTRLPGGRRRLNAAMKQGSKIHQALEDEVHTTVKIDIMTKEDGFGLKLWNLIQGLRTLRDTGLTRELEVWGMVDGEVVNGVIDSVSYEHPNPEFEDELEQSSQESALDHGQSRLPDYFPPKGKKSRTPKIYLSDVKTRGSLFPVSTAIVRPAKIQLLLYHRFLGDMAAGRLDYLKIFRRYGLDADDPFSDSFVAQLGSLHDEIFDDKDDDSPPSSSNPNANLDLLKYNTLRELVTLVEQELSLTFPEGEESLGHFLRVQYLYRDDGRELDVHDFPVSKQALEKYLSGYMAWWKGERDAKGVSIEEAFKCRSCEFAPDCTWREGMEFDLVSKAGKKVVSRAATMW